MNEQGFYQNHSSVKSNRNRCVNNASAAFHSKISIVHSLPFLKRGHIETAPTLTFSLHKIYIYIRVYIKFSAFAFDLQHCSPNQKHSHLFVFFSSHSFRVGSIWQEFPDTQYTKMQLNEFRVFYFYLLWNIPHRLFSVYIYIYMFE